MGSNRNALKAAQVAAAAEECFRRYGVRRTSMADVAEALGVTRQTVYRVFESRTNLLQYIANQRITELATRLKSEFAKFTSLEDALVEGSMISIEAGRSDTLLDEIQKHSDDHGFEQFLFRGSADVHIVMLELWGPLLDQARQAGQLRDGVTNERAVGWIRNVHALIMLRDDYDQAEKRRVLEDFVVSSLCVSRKSD